MTRWVVDSSVVLKWFLEEPHGDKARRLLDLSEAFDAPTLMPIEVANILSKRARAGIVSLDYAGESRTILRRMPIRLHDTEELLDSAFDLSVRTGQTVYDCLFLALAVLVGSRLVTADKRFIRGLRSSDWQDRVAWIADIA